MRKTYHTRNARVSLLVGGLGLLLVAPAFGQEPAPAPAAAAPAPAAGCTSCDSTGCSDTGCDACSSCGETGCNGGCCLFGDCCLGDPWLLSDQLCCLKDECGDPCVTIAGFTNWGYHSESTGLFLVNPDKVNNEQSWLYIEKVADGSEGLDFGFRGDIMYGTQAFTTQAFGNPPGTWDFQNGWDHGIYGWALPQLYGQVAYGDWSIIAGHFYTLAGYEVVPATGNFFYSHAFTMFNSEPFTHTGAYATYTGVENVTLYGGWTAGWDTGFEAFNDGDNSDGSNFLGGAKLTLLEDTTLTYITTIGDLGTRGEGYTHSIVFNTMLTEKLNYVLLSDLVEVNAAGGANHQYSVVNYLFYWYNDCLGLGGRAEWWKNGGESVYEVTAGLNVKPHANLNIRPEWRYQWSNDAVQIPAGVADDEGIFAIDAILTF
jgi:hypothetical protein